MMDSNIKIHSAGKYERNGSVGIVRRAQAARPSDQPWLRYKQYVTFINSGPHTAFYKMSTEGSSPGGKTEQK
jgi:hypothetical protein